MENGGKVCVVTGASSGIGAAVAKAMKADGHLLVVTGRRKERLRELEGEGVSVLAGDLTSHEFADSIDKHVYDLHGRCDVLFNCAGSLHNGSIEDIDIDKMSRMVRLNVESTFRLSYRFLKRFKVQGHGHVITISSVLGTKVRPTAGPYAGTKYAIEALSESLRMELAGTNIRVTCIEPGLVMTELHRDLDVHPRVSMNIRQPLTTDDIVEAVRFVLSQPDHVSIPRLMILPRDQAL